MKRGSIALLLTICMLAGLLVGCGGKQEDSAGTPPAQETGTDGEAKSYTYRTTYSSVSTWNPTDWQIFSEWDLIGCTMSPFYGFWMNETKDGYDIVCELAAEFPVDVTADYAGNEIYGVPVDATEGYAWQVTLRQDATWEDGTPINADDVEYALQQLPR